MPLHAHLGLLLRCFATDMSRIQLAGTTETTGSVKQTMQQEPAADAVLQFRAERAAAACNSRGSAGGSAAAVRASQQLEYSTEAVVRSGRANTAVHRWEYSAAEEVGAGVQIGCMSASHAQLLQQLPDHIQSSSCDICMSPTRAVSSALYHLFLQTFLAIRS